MSKILSKIKREVLSLGQYGSIWNFAHGFKKETIALNGVTHTNYRSFMSDRRYRKGHPYNARFSSIIDNKMYLPYLLKDYQQYCPVYYFFVSDGKVKSMKNNIDDGIQAFLNFLADEKKVALKQCYSSLGKGFHVIEQSEMGGVIIDKKESTIAQLESLFKHCHDYVCTEYVKQHEYSMNISSSSLNTLRFLCVRDTKTEKFYVARCFHRFGVEGSLVDNLGGGNGYLFLVDKETGQIKPNGAKNVMNDGEVYMDELDYPDNKVYGGMQIPRFQEVCDKIVEISNSFPFLRYVGWDVAITDDGFKIIEANSLTSLGVLQREGGYMDDPDLRRFFTGI